MSSAQFNLSFSDGGDAFRLGAADQLIAALIRAVFQSRASGRHLIIGLPRGDNDLAILTGFLGHLLRMQAWQETGAADPWRSAGPWWSSPATLQSNSVCRW